MTSLFIWDFDWSLINENSDTYILKAYDKQFSTGGTCEKDFKNLLKTGDYKGQWTLLMDTMLSKYTGHSSTSSSSATPLLSPKDVKSIIGNIPIFEEVIPFIKRLGSDKNIYQVIVSDANTVFIKDFLEFNGLTEFIDEIHTNPGYYESDTGKLRVKPYVDYHNGFFHGCPRCKTKNICKGQIVNKIFSSYLDSAAEMKIDEKKESGDTGGDDNANLKTVVIPVSSNNVAPETSSSQQTLSKEESPSSTESPPSTSVSSPPFTRCYYVGDGSGDICGSLQFQNKKDIIFARKDYSLCKALLTKDKAHCHARVVQWDRISDIISVFADSTTETDN
eukprot:g4196.t1